MDKYNNNIKQTQDNDSDFIFDQVHSPCINPIVDAYWDWKDTNFHVQGLVKADHEIVKVFDYVLTIWNYNN